MHRGLGQAPQAVTYLDKDNRNFNECIFFLFNNIRYVVVECASNAALQCRLKYDAQHVTTVVRRQQVKMK